MFRPARNLTVSFACAALAVAFCASIAVAQGRPATKPATNPATSPADDKMPQGEWAFLVGELKDSLKEPQLATIRKEALAEREALQTLDGKREQAMAARKAASEKNDKEAVEKARAELKALGDQIQAARTKAKDAIYAVLTDDQKIQWEAFKLARGAASMLGRSKVQLDDAQFAKAKELGKPVAKEMLAAKDDDELRRIRVKFMGAIREQVLTADQRKALETAGTQPSTTRPAATRPRRDRE